MRYGSVCSGIEAATVAWHPLGWQAAWYSEIEPFPCAVLKHHYPAVPNYGDMTKFEEWRNEPIDLLVGGTPCQSFSVAGLRKGLADPRGNLMLTYLAIAQRHRPRWLVWENVPGVLSSGRGRDFGTFLGALGELGYGWAYRVLDAQWFGVAQRRRRVFVIGYLGDWRRAAQVLFERESVRRDTAPSREKGQETAQCLTTGVGKRYDAESETLPVTFGAQMSVPQTDVDLVQTLQAKNPMAVAHPIHYRKSRRAQSTTDHETWVEDDATNTLNCFDVGDVRATDVVTQPMAIRTANTGANGHGIAMNVTHTLDQAQGQAVAQPIAPALTATNDPSRSPQSSEVTAQVLAVMKATAQPVAFDSYNLCETSDTMQTIKSPQGGVTESVGAVMTAMQVRRLTPVECERLQGFPDNYTNIPWRKATDSPDGPRYKALGNSMAVPVMAWIGKRIKQVDEL